MILLPSGVAFAVTPVQGREESDLVLTVSVCHFDVVVPDPSQK